jgi:pyridoxal phosphate enzyme (YggS family)
MIHSVDSLKLAEEISKQAVKAGRVIPILIEVNIADEVSKFGVAPLEAEALIRSMAPLPGVSVKGLMTVAPYTDDPEDNRTYFRALKQLSVDITSKNIDNITMGVLSMGMTGDYEVAIEEGASYVRVGTGIFGARNYAVG